ncbi:MAG: DEAD/DEAH box helicase family protein [Marmoricola sp.]
MRLRFKVQPYQSEAVDAVVGCFAGQPFRTRLDLRNADVEIGDRLLDNVRAVQERAGLETSERLATSPAGPINLDVEMETGTGKTYVYVKTILELHKRYGWSRYVVVVPSIAIREGVKSTFEATAQHFAETYGTRPHFFVYSSHRLHDVNAFATDAGIQVMIINIQAFNATGKDARRIYEELDQLGSRRPIDVISGTHPIVIVDEPQRISAEKSLDALGRLDALAVLRYSATHRIRHDLVHRLDAVDAYQRKLVKRIGVRGITVQGFSGSAYLFLREIETRAGAKPRARVELEFARGDSVRRTSRWLELGARIHDLTGNDAYRGLVVTDIDAVRNVVELSNGEVVGVGQVTEDPSEETLRRLQIREVIRAHLTKESELFARGIKVLSLFFIDEVVRYRDYARDDTLGEYARTFEEEYEREVADVLTEAHTGDPYAAHLRAIAVRETHAGYFSIDRKGRQVDPDVKRTGEEKGQSTDVAAYDLILKDKERLLSLTEPVRFLFSHSALREGWDNPNVFVIGMLKRSDSGVSRRQEVGRGLRLAVDQHGERMDDPALVHRINELTVVTDESYTEFVDGLQREIAATLPAGHQRELPTPVDARARVVDETPLETGPREVVLVSFDSEELIASSIRALEAQLTVDQLTYVVSGGRQTEDSFEATGSEAVISDQVSEVRYDLVAEVVERTRLTRRTVGRILSEVSPDTFALYRQNPSQFIERAARLVKAELDTLIAADSGSRSGSSA